MAGIGGGEPFSHENVAQMAAAVGAFHLDPHAVGVGKMLHGTLNLFVEGWPAAMGVEFINRPVDLGVALAADIGAGFVEIVVFTGEGPFRPLGLDHAPFFGSEGIVALFSHVRSLPQSAEVAGQVAGQPHYARLIDTASFPGRMAIPYGISARWLRSLHTIAASSRGSTLTFEIQYVGNT